MKTTLAGVAAVITSVVTHFFPQYLANWISLLGILVGLGLIAAKDANPV